MPSNAREWRSAILICLRMNARSAGVTVKPVADRRDRCLGLIVLAGRRQGGGGHADGGRQDGVGRRPHQQPAARSPASRGFRPQYPAAPETRSVHNSPPHSDEMGCRIPPHGETAHPTIQARTFRNLLVFRCKISRRKRCVNRRNWASSDRRRRTSYDRTSTYLLRLQEVSILRSFSHPDECAIELCVLLNLFFSSEW